MKYFLFIFVLILQLMFPRGAIAGVDCTITGGNWTIAGTLSFQPDDPPGTESQAITPTGTYHVACNNPDRSSHDILIDYSTAATLLDDSAGIFATDMDGIGIKLFINFENATGFDLNCDARDILINAQQSQKKCIIMRESKGSFDITGYVKFVKVSASVGGGVISKIPEITTHYNIIDTTSSASGPDLWNGNSNVVMDGVACTVNGGNIAVPIGNFKNTDFQQPGFTTGETAFNVGLTCDPGANINVTLRGKQNPDTSNTSVLALSDSDGDAAQGVGVQILYDDKPLNIEEKVPIKQSAGGDEVLPFSARYYQTKTQVTAGTANTVATLDLTYQ